MQYKATHGLTVSHRFSIFSISRFVSHGLDVFLHLLCRVDCGIWPFSLPCHGITSPKGAFPMSNLNFFDHTEPYHIASQALKVLRNQEKPSEHRCTEHLVCQVEPTGPTP